MALKIFLSCVNPGRYLVDGNVDVVLDVGPVGVTEVVCKLVKSEGARRVARRILSATCHFLITGGSRVFAFDAPLAFGVDTGLFPSSCARSRVRVSHLCFNLDGVDGAAEVD